MVLTVAKSLFLKKQLLHMSNLSQEAWVSQLIQDKNAIIIDVRTEEEVGEGYIPGMIHMNIYEGPGFIEKIENLDPSKNYYVYCRSGKRSGQACAIMNSKGIPNAYNLLGGILEWEGEIEGAE